MLRDLLSQEINMKKGVVALMILGLVVTTSVTGFLLANRNSDIIISKDASNTRSNINQLTDSSMGTNTDHDNNNANRQDEEPEEEIKVYVVGEVNNPGVVTLKKGQLIYDAIELAGGPTEKADVENINMVYELKENVMVRVKSKEENQPDKTEEENRTLKNDGNSGISIIRDSAGAVVEENNNDNKGTTSSKININTASADELMTLPGIGPSTAEKIISYREQNGEFKKIEDIMNVSGIGEGKFNKMKDYITVK